MLPAHTCHFLHHFHYREGSLWRWEAPQSRESVLTAAATSVLRTPPHRGPSTVEPGPTHWALGVGPGQARRGLLRVTRRARLGKVEGEGLSPWAKGKSAQTNGVEPVYLGWKRQRFSALLNCFLKTCLSLPRRKQTQRRASSRAALVAEGCAGRAGGPAGSRGRGRQQQGPRGGRSQPGEDLRSWC